jgi:hypothetical protein
MKKLIIDVPDDMKKEIKLQALESDETLKQYVSDILYTNMIIYLSTVKDQKKMLLNISNQDLRKRLSDLRMSRLKG